MKNKETNSGHVVEWLSLGRGSDRDMPESLAAEARELAVEGFGLWIRRQEHAAKAGRYLGATVLSAALCSAVVLTAPESLAQAVTANPGTDRSEAVANVAYLFNAEP